MRRTAIQRLGVLVTMVVTLGAYSTPALATERPTNAQAAAIVKGMVYTPAAAKHRVAKVFTLVRVPVAAVAEAGITAPGSPAPDSLDADLYTKDDGHWWRVPGTRTTMLAWVRKHPPIGFKDLGTSTASGTTTTLFGPASTKAGCCTSIELTVGHAAGHTTLSAAVFVEWQPSRTAVEHIPATVTHALLEVGSDVTQAQPSYPNTSLEVSVPALTPVITTLNHLAATRPEPIPCPYTPNWSKATFRYAGHVVLFASPSACPYVEVTVDGTPSTWLSGNITTLIAQVLGVTATPPTM